MAVHKKHQHLLSLSKNTSKLDIFVSTIGSIEPLTSIPQVLKLWQLRQADEFSLFTWLFGLFATLVWLIYGIKKKSFAVWFTSILWIMVYVPIVIAIILFG